MSEAHPCHLYAGIEPVHACDPRKWSWHKSVVLQVFASVAIIISLDITPQKDKFEWQELPLALRCGILALSVVGLVGIVP